jgi:hypothetical protein
MFLLEDVSAGRCFCWKMFLLKDVSAEPLFTVSDRDDWTFARTQVEGGFLPLVACFDRENDDDDSFNTTAVRPAYSLSTPTSPWSVEYVIAIRFPLFSMVCEGSKLA